MRVTIPGLIHEPGRGYRVRMAGNKAKRISIPCGPDHPDFWEHYYAARVGKTYTPPTPPEVTPDTLQWLVDRYLAHIEKAAKAGLYSPLTVKQRRSQLNRLCAHTDAADVPYGELTLNLPAAAFVQVRDAWMDRSAEADNLMKSVRAMYAWGIETGLCDVNPAKGIGKIHKPRGGAKPWTVADLRKFTARWPEGTTAHAWLMLALMTGCRIDDARKLGRQHEVERAGVTWLEWQPGKKGSAPMALPMMPQLKRSLRALKVQGQSYLLTEYGKPFASTAGIIGRVKDWCKAAGLDDLSSHGVRKAFAELLAEAGCSQHQIMAVMAHTQAKTSEVYTKGAQRRLMAQDAMQVLAGFEL